MISVIVIMDFLSQFIHPIIDQLKVILHARYYSVYYLVTGYFVKPPYGIIYYMDEQDQFPKVDPPKTISPNEIRKQRLTAISITVVGILLFAGFITALVFLLNPNLSTEGAVARIRDVFIIVMSLESLLIGAALIILIVQLARLTNLLQNEVKPILDSTNETVNTLRGTTEFLSDNLVEPVLKLNEYIAVIQKFFELLGLKQSK